MENMNKTRISLNSVLHCSINAMLNIHMGFSCEFLLNWLNSNMLKKLFNVLLSALSICGLKVCDCCLLVIFLCIFPNYEWSRWQSNMCDSPRMIMIKKTQYWYKKMGSGWMPWIEGHRASPDPVLTKDLYEFGFETYLLA